MSHDVNTTSRKRSREAASYVGDDNTSPSSEPPPKRASRFNSSATDPQASRIQDDAPNSQADEWSEPYDFEDIIMQSSFLKTLKIVHKELTVPFERPMLAVLSLYIQKGTSQDIKRRVEAIDRWFASYPPTDSVSEQDVLKRLQKEWQVLQDELYRPLAPSTFCKSSNWARQQKGPAFINCGRPLERSGLPLNLLHPLFAKFLALIEGPAPPDGSDPKFILAEQVATGLCQEMPRSFDTENGRLDEFKGIISPLFEGIGVLDGVEVGQGRADFGLQYSQVGLVLIGEGRNEPGGSDGDPYMQVAASYNAWARGMEKARQTNTGCPCFVFCVNGPNILFGGGFRDNEVSVVEPLSDWCIMMQHTQLKRERVLARHLYALLHCLNDRSKFSTPLPSRTACCPRIYDAFLTSDTQESVQMKFIEPFKHRSRHDGVYDLLFRASVEEKTGDDLPAKESPVLVKVPRGSDYGLEPHVLAAKAGFAPRLLGTASVPGAPVIYVMDLLGKSEGWFHLVWYELPKHITERQKDRLRVRKEEFISFLSQNELVHGDLRGCNVMCRLRDKDEVDLGVLDWDWAGKRGVARYPAALNVEAGYQGLPGGLIEASHDEDMLSKTLDDILH